MNKKKSTIQEFLKYILPTNIKYEDRRVTRKDKKVIYRWKEYFKGLLNQVKAG